MSEQIDWREQHAQRLKRLRATILADVLPLAIVCLVAAGLWHVYKKNAREQEREVDAWIAQVKSRPDSWKRFQAFAHGHESTTSEQLAIINRLADAALRESLVERNAAAFHYIEDSPRSYGPEWREQYPRDPGQRRAQIEALRLAWPSIDELTAADRLDLVDMAARCHLQEASPPVVRETVLDCVRAGAHSLGTTSKLTRLMDFAQLGEALTKNAQAK